MSWEITSRCPSDCIYCGRRQEPPGEELDTARAISLIEQAAEAGCIRISLTGGEPFLRDDLPEVLSACSDAGIEVPEGCNGEVDAGGNALFPGEDPGAGREAFRDGQAAREITAATEILGKGCGNQGCVHRRREFRLVQHVFSFRFQWAARRVLIPGPSMCPFRQISSRRHAGDVRGKSVRK